jgi:hypothetical protein
VEKISYMSKRVFRFRTGIEEEELDRQEKSNVILLTACVDPGEVAFVARRDPHVRLEDYKRSMRLWLANRRVPRLVFCENSGYDLTEVEKMCGQYNIHNKQVELLTFNGQDFSPHLGKGYGEMRIIAHALARSRLIQDHPMVMKVTGRFYVPNAGAIIKAISRIDADVFCDLRWNLTFADSRVFCASVPFLQQYLLPLQELLDDSRNISFEKVLALAVHQAMADGRHWAMLPYAADIRGTSATGNTVFPSSIIYRAKRELFRLIKTGVLAR